jgi:hypothetical protein
MHRHYPAIGLSCDRQSLRVLNSPFRWNWPQHILVSGRCWWLNREPLAEDARYLGDGGSLYRFALTNDHRNSSERGQRSGRELPPIKGGAIVVLSIESSLRQMQVWMYKFVSACLTVPPFALVCLHPQSLRHSVPMTEKNQTVV